jgi:hypothetical protein
MRAQKDFAKKFSSKRGIFEAVGVQASACVPKNKLKLELNNRIEFRHAFRHC